MHYGRLVQLDVASVLPYNQHAQTHQCISQIWILILELDGVAGGAFGAFGAL